MEQEPTGPLAVVKLMEAAHEKIACTYTLDQTTLTYTFRLVFMRATRVWSLECKYFEETVEREPEAVAARIIKEVKASIRSGREAPPTDNAGWYDTDLARGHRLNAEREFAKKQQMIEEIQARASIVEAIKKRA